jgi:hypothetical protein
MTERKIANARPVIANAVKQSRRRRNLDCFVPRNDGEENRNDGERSRNDGFRWRGLAARADNDGSNINYQIEIIILK